ncbi:hypothetical protein [Nitrososphaera viennensis]|uniref:Uncharacterized protein n=2 Tax=Nitrososphaera viennensis TaxID=1034015 RepID=A0A060HQG7_9ARCH|nr:hypothetical protein [Nitrososphaera viennensis]AIC15786.1 hypothetical protein NVIE_015400 [Nitrososphaera viennensis EN76]UVS67782.1 hypothetical protein NWT39_07660 [Nitrososphaera viennensis]
MQRKKRIIRLDGARRGCDAMTKTTSNEADELEINKLISLGVDAEFARTLPRAARRQILKGVLGLQKP